MPSSCSPSALLKPVTITFFLTFLQRVSFLPSLSAPLQPEGAIFVFSLCHTSEWQYFLEESFYTSGILIFTPGDAVFVAATQGMPPHARLALVAGWGGGLGELEFLGSLGL